MARCAGGLQMGCTWCAHGVHMACTSACTNACAEACTEACTGVRWGVPGVSQGVRWMCTKAYGNASTEACTGVRRGVPRRAHGVHMVNPKMSTLRPGVDIFVTPGSHSLGPTARAHENVHLQAWPPSATQFAKYCWGMGLPRSVFDGAKFATLLEKTSTWQCYVAMFC